MSRARESFSRHRTLVVCLLIAAAFAAAHGGRVKAGFHRYQWEDRIFIDQNDRSIHSLADCFTKTSVWPGLYRPLTTNLYYFLGRHLFSSRIEVYHVISVVFYLANAFLLYLISLRLMALPWAALAPLIFASRLAHAEVVTNSCESQSLLSVFFTLAALYLFMKSGARRNWLFQALSLAAFALALLSKETAVVFPALVIVFGGLLDAQLSWKRYLSTTLAAGLCIVIFVLAWKRIAGYQDTGLHFNVSFSNIVGNYSAYLLSFSDFLTFKSPSVVMTPAVSGIASTQTARIVFIILTAAAVAFFFLGHQTLKGELAAAARVFFFGLLFFLIAEAPYVILAGRQFMRYAYLGHAGLALSAGVSARAIATALRRMIATRSRPGENDARETPL